MKKIIVSAIVPAYNEEKNIHQVLLSLKNAKLVDEIICVNDGSTDNTQKEIDKVSGITALNLEKNCGKSCAIVKGVKASRGSIIVFIDADLEGEIGPAADTLVTPLIDNTHDVAIGYPLANSIDKFFRPLSGERAYFATDLKKILNKLEHKGYGMELFLNFTFKDKRITCFPLQGIIHKLKHQKQAYQTVVKLTLIEILDIMSEVFSQKNPPSFFLRSYIYSFYLKKPNVTDSRLDRMVEHVRDFFKK